jgi:hypothetical protein
MIQPAMVSRMLFMTLILPANQQGVDCTKV